MRAALCLAVLLAPSSAQAFTLHTTVTNACHEPITLEALARTSPPAPAVDVPDDTPFFRMAEHFGRALEVGPPASDLDALHRTSLVLGVRDPDLRGNGPSDLIHLRWVHLPDLTQDDHFLRRGEHDGAAGVTAAAEEGRERLLALIEASAAAYAADPDATRLVRVRAWVQYYRHVEIAVWEPMYLLAQALHLVQDSFTHTYRTDDLRTILTIQNYVEAVGKHHDRERDGPPHSNALDDCTRPDATDLREAAVIASAALMTATFTYWREGRRDEVDGFVSDWMSLEPGCEAGTCTSRWIAIAQSDETGTTGCAVRPARSAAPAWLAPLGLAAILGALRRGARAPRERSSSGALAPMRRARSGPESSSSASSPRSSPPC